MFSSLFFVMFISFFFFFLFLFTFFGRYFDLNMDLLAVNSAWAGMNRFKLPLPGPFQWPSLP